MNVGRFNAAVYVLKSIIGQEKVIDKINALISHLQQAITQQTPESISAYKNQYKGLQETLLSSSLKMTSATRWKIYQEIDAIEWFGEALWEKIAKIIDGNTMTPTSAIEGLQVLNKNISAYYKKITTLDNVLDELSVELSDLNEGMFEVGVSLPKDVIGNKLKDMAKEFSEINTLVNAFQEITGYSGEGVHVKEISASEWQLFIESMPVTAAAISVAIERIVCLYKTNLEIKLLQKQLEDRELPEKVIEPLKSHIEETVGVELRKIADELVDDYYKGDEGRRNELKVMMSRSLKYMADRLDKGAVFEVSAEPPSKPQEDMVDAGRLAEYEEMVRLASVVRENGYSVRQLRVGEEPILAIDFQGNEKDTDNE